jgi:hypothetical protein
VEEEMPVVEVEHEVGDGRDYDEERSRLQDVNGQERKKRIWWAMPTVFASRRKRRH